MVARAGAAHATGQHSVDRRSFAILMSWQSHAQLSGPGQPSPLAPLTTAGETAVLTLLHGLLPPIFLGLGPQWTRVAAVSVDAASGSTNVSLLLNTFVPVIGNDTSDTFPEVTTCLIGAHTSL